MHMPFEGTISFTPDTYMRVVTETCVSTAKHGAKYLLILNWHEGNIPSLAIAAESLHRDHGMTVLTVQACYVAEELYGHSCNGLTHGGEIEALAVLAYRPGPRASRSHRQLVRSFTRPQDGQAAANASATNRCSPTSVLSRRPAGSAARNMRPRKRARACSTDISNAIAKEAAEIFKQLDAVQGGTAEIKHLRQAI